MEDSPDRSAGHLLGRPCHQGATLGQPEGTGGCGRAQKVQTGSQRAQGRLSSVFQVPAEATLQVGSEPWLWAR